MTKYLNYIKDKTNLNKSFIIVESTNTNKKIYGFNNVKDIYNVKRTQTLEYTQENIDILIEELDTTNIIEIIEINSFYNTFKIIEKLSVKKCTKCKITKSKDEFHKDKSKKNGIDTKCKVCKNNYNTNRHYILRERREKNKIHLLKRLGNKCEDCKLKFNGKNIFFFTFHHLEPSKKSFSLSENKNHTLLELEKEVDKCIILCHNCHNKYHYLNGYS